MEHSLGTDCLLSKLESLNCSPMEVLNYSEAPPSTHDGLGGVVVAEGSWGGKPDVDFGLLKTLANIRGGKRAHSKNSLSGQGQAQDKVGWS